MKNRYNTQIPQKQEQKPWEIAQNRSIPPGYEHYEQQIQAIRPNNQYQIEKNPNGQIYKNYNPQPLPYQSILGDTKLNTVEELQNHMQKYGLYPAIAEGNINIDPKYRNEELTAQNAINATLQGQITNKNIEMGAIRTKRYKAQGLNAWGKVPNATLQQQAQQVYYPPSIQEQIEPVEQIIPVNNIPTWAVIGSDHDNMGQKIYNLKSSNGKKAGPMTKAGILQYYPEAYWNVK